MLSLEAQHAPVPVKPGRYFFPRDTCSPETSRLPLLPQPLSLLASLPLTVGAAPPMPGVPESVAAMFVAAPELPLSEPATATPANETMMATEVSMERMCAPTMVCQQSVLRAVKELGSYFDQKFWKHSVSHLEINVEAGAASPWRSFSRHQIRQNEPGRSPRRSGQCLTRTGRHLPVIAGSAHDREPIMISVRGGYADRERRRRASA